MATVARHPILYDVARWRRYRTWILLPATVAALTAVFSALLRPASGSGFTYSVVAVGLYAFAASLWVRQRFTYLSCEGDKLVVRALGATHRLGAADIDRARAIRLGAVFGRPERHGLLPRPAERWMNVEAISIRLRDGVDRRNLRRVAGARCVVDDLFVVPVDDADSLLAEINAQVCPVRPVAAADGSRRRGRRR